MYTEVELYDRERVRVDKRVMEAALDARAMLNKRIWPIAHRVRAGGVVKSGTFSVGTLAGTAYENVGIQKLLGSDFREPEFPESGFPVHPFRSFLYCAGAHLYSILGGIENRKASTNRDYFWNMFLLETGLAFEKQKPEAERDEELIGDLRTHLYRYAVSYAEEIEKQVHLSEVLEMVFSRPEAMAA